jgi:hypothetical protein
MTAHDWQAYIYRVSLLASELLAGIVAVLAIFVVLKNLADDYWTSYKTKQKCALLDHVQGFLHRDDLNTETPLLYLSWPDMLILRDILLERCRFISTTGFMTPSKKGRVSLLYQISGLAKREIGILTRSPFWWRRADAARSLGLIGISGAKTHLVAAIHDRNTKVRFEAIFALGHMGCVDTVPFIIEGLALYMKTSASRIGHFVAELGNPCLPILLKMCGHSDHDIQLLAIGLVGAFKSPIVLPVILPLLDAPQIDIRLAACKAVGTIGDAHALSKLIPMLNDSTWQMRAQAAKQFGQNGFTPSAKGLSRCLEDKAWWVRFNAGEALSRMGNVGKVTLQNAVYSKDRFARDMAIQWLDQRGENRDKSYEQIKRAQPIAA